MELQKFFKNRQMGIKKGDYKSPLKKSNFWFVQKPML